MSYRTLDAKLKTLIQLCKETHNYKKLAVVGFILTSNRVNEIGIYLGMRPRNQSSGEKLFEYMTLINEIFKKNLKITIFHQASIERAQECELLFLKNRGNISLEYVKQILSVYYELRQLEVPNLHKTIDHENFLASSKLGPLSLLSSGKRKRDRNSDTLMPLILQKITEKESNLQKNLQYELNGEKLETAIHLRSIKNSLMNDKKGKIRIHGALKDNLTYQASLESIYGYFIMGLIILLTSLGTVIFIGFSFFAMPSGQLSSWALILYGSATVLIYFYLKQFRTTRS
ncbi:MAG: hypothetical protein ACFFDF_14550 [Candidatus Odinarchaeota archaeon]